MNRLFVNMRLWFARKFIFIKTAEEPLSVDLISLLIVEPETNRIIYGFNDNCRRIFRSVNIEIQNQKQFNCVNSPSIVIVYATELLDLIC